MTALYILFGIGIGICLMQLLKEGENFKPISKKAKKNVSKLRKRR